MRRLLLVFLLALVPSLALAQSNVVVNYKNTGATGATTVTPANPLPVTMSATPTGASTAANQTAVQGPVAPGAATATKSVLTGCQYNATAYAPTDTQQMNVGCDQNGRLLTVDGAANLVTSTPTVQNAQYVSGNCVGGFNAITVANYNGQSGYVINARVASVAGGTETVTIYLFSANPSASTCTDKSTFTLNTADISKVIANPVNTSVTLSAPTGATPSFGSSEFTPPRPFIAGGSAASGVKTIYYAIVGGSTFTPATVSDLQVTIGVALN